MWRLHRPYETLLRRPESKPICSSPWQEHTIHTIPYTIPYTLGIGCVQGT